MSWIALVGPELEENLGLRSLASSLERAGFRAEIQPLNNPGLLVPVRDHILAADEPPLMVALSLAFQWRAMDFLALALALRQGGYAGHVTAGGHFGTFAARELLRDYPELDSICRHEAEEIVVDLARALADGRPWDRIPGLALRDEAGEVALTPARVPPDLEALPWPDRRGVPMSCLGHGIAPMAGSRGCYARCSFCCIAAWHRQSASRRPFRLRSVEDVANEMAWLHHDKQIDIFIFHDDNFFVPSRRANLRRIHGLADALEDRGVGRISTVVKARPTDADREVFTAVRDRLGCTRIFLGIETDADQGLATLGRDATRRDNHAAMDLLEELGIYACFNMLVFDPDTTLESLEINLEFMDAYSDSPFNFARVELYAGTPLLARLQGEGRCRGDYMGWDYDMASRDVQRVFELSMECFFERNFGPGAVTNRLMGTRCDVEICRYFHPDVYQPAWRDEARQLNRQLTRGGVDGLRRIIRFVRKRGPDADARGLVGELTAALRAEETAVARRAATLEEKVQRTVGARCRHARPAELPAPRSAPDLPPSTPRTPFTPGRGVHPS